MSAFRMLVSAVLNLGLLTGLECSFLIIIPNLQTNFNKYILPDLSRGSGILLYTFCLSLY